MPVQIQYQTNDICVLRTSGILKRSEFGAEQSALARHIDTGSQPRLLVILENFEGWERGADWNDLDFTISHGGQDFQNNHRCRGTLGDSCTRFCRSGSPSRTSEVLSV